ncbi:MAG: methyl-accepting chemotaxis protein [Solirubrobacterales bacterium]
MNGLVARLMDIRIAIKVFIAPILLIAAILLLGLIFKVGMDRQGVALDHLYSVSFEKARFSGRMAGEVASMHADLYRLLGANDEDKQARGGELSASIAAELARLPTAFSTFEANVAWEEDERALTEEIKKNLAAYTKGAGEVLALTAADRTSASRRMPEVEEAYDSVKVMLQALNDYATQRTQIVHDGAVDVGGQARTQFYGLLALCLAVGLVVMVAMARLISRPVVQITGVMDTLAQGVTEVAIPSLERRDEIGAMARAVKVFRDNMIRARELEARDEAERERQSAEMARRDRLTADFNATMGRMMAAVMETVRHVHTASDNLSATAAQTTQQGAAVASAAEQAAANVQSVSASAHHLNQAVDQISRRIDESSAITRDAVRGVQTANGTMEGLAQAAGKIGEIVNLINDIASQTNLLALNATIEAARAGDAGKGFAVVANEVKSLANQTARATEEIGNHIAGIQAISRDAVDIIRSVGATIDRVNQVVASIATAVAGQADATRDIVESVGHAAAGNAEITRNIAEVSRAAGATGEMATGMFRAANELVEEAETLKTEVGTFLDAMRAA